MLSNILVDLNIVKSLGNITKFGFCHVFVELLTFSLFSFFAGSLESAY